MHLINQQFWDALPLRSMITAAFLWYRRIYWISRDEKLSQQGILSLFSCKYTMKNAHVHLLWHTHSNSRCVPVHVFSCYDGECVHLPYIYIFKYNPNEKSRQTQRFIANALLNAFDKVNWRCTATPFQDQRHTLNSISTPKDTVWTGHSKSILMHIYNEICKCFSFLAYIHIPTPGMCQYMFFLLWRGMRACTTIHIYTCKKQANSKIYCERTSECTRVIRKFWMHCHSFQWSASKLYDIWSGSWNYNSKRNRLNGAF